jgi:hypothetical protein
MNLTERALEIGERLGVRREQSSCDYSYLRKIRQRLEEVSGGFDELAFIQKMIDVLEAA